MLSLLDIPTLKKLPFGKYKIHLATGTNPTPFNAFLEGKFKEWQAQQNGRNFECDTIISLIGLEVDQWLFAGVYRVLGITKGTESPYLYETELLPGQDDLIGRVIVRYQRPSRASYIWGHKYAQHLEVLEIKRERVSIEPFPGYNNVVLDHARLRVVVSLQEPTWKSALSHVKGVYLIADASNGKAYVGSATGAEGIWQRWEMYAAIGHGWNVQLCELLDVIKGKGAEHASNFRYSILEIADSHATVEFIKDRESHWKRILLTGTWGYNSN
jgi:hypothetical protein